MERPAWGLDTARTSPTAPAGAVAGGPPRARPRLIVWRDIIPGVDVPKEFERALDKGGEHVGRSYRVASCVGFAVAAGLVVLSAVVRWYRTSFGNLDYATTMRVVVPGVTLVTLGTVVILNSFLCSMLGLDRR